MSFILTQYPSVADHFVAELRNVDVQKDRMRFRRNLERIGELLAYEISKTLSYKPTRCQTPLGFSDHLEVERPIVLATILRASLPFHQGFLNIFDDAENAFIGAYRSHSSEKEGFEIAMNYITCPDLTDKTLILMDPMLATGRSLEKVYRELQKFGVPAETHIAAVIASREGMGFVQSRMPECKLWLGVVDNDLNEYAYIVPGLGDAGDLAFGPKNG